MASKALVHTAYVSGISEARETFIPVFVFAEREGTVTFLQECEAARCQGGFDIELDRSDDWIFRIENRQSDREIRRFLKAL